MDAWEKQQTYDIITKEKGAMTARNGVGWGGEGVEDGSVPRAGNDWGGGVGWGWKRSSSCHQQ